MKDERHQNEGQTDNVSIGDCFAISMFSPKEYGKLIKLKAGKITLYVVLLTLLAAVIQYAIPVASAIAAMGGMKKLVLNELPDFSLKDGELYIGEKFERSDEQSGVYIIVDTEVEKFTKDDAPANVIEAIMVSKTNVLVYNGIMGLGGMVQENQFSDFKDLNIDNQVVADMSGFIYTVLGFMFVFTWILTLFKYLFVALFYSAAMLLLVQSVMVETTFGKNYKVALFAQSIGAIVVAVTYCIGNSLFIMAGSIFNIFITVAIMNRALILNVKEGL